MAAVDYFLKIDGIDGESQDAKHKNEIQVLTFELHAVQSGSSAIGGGLSAGKVSFHDIAFTSEHSKASPKLMLACATGEHIKKAVLTCRKAGTEQQEYLKITLADILVSSYKTVGSQQQILPLDYFTLNFAQIEKEYKEQKADGTLGGAVKVGYNLKLNKKV